MILFNRLVFLYKVYFIFLREVKPEKNFDIKTLSLETAVSIVLLFRDVTFIGEVAGNIPKK
jgi:hypothetical protein